MSFDVAIAGGGPAGAATAIALARLGRKVLLVDRGAPHQLRAGEGLPPSPLSLLRLLGVADEFLRQGHRQSFGNVSVWGSSEPEFTDFVQHPYGTGHQLDRRRFDSMLVAAAQSLGVEVVHSTRLSPESCDFGDQMVAGKTTRCAELRTVRLEGLGTQRLVGCRWLVDAGGRSSNLSRNLGAARVRFDALVAIALLLKSGASTDQDGRTWVEAVEDGWWYSALLPTGERLVVHLTDRDLMSSDQVRNPGELMSKLQATRHLWPFCDRHGYAPVDRPQTWSAATTQLSQFAGAGWIAVGDASQSFDPLSSQGISQALYCGLQAAQALHEALAGRQEALLNHLATQWRIFAAYRQHWYKAYGSERRWPGSVFWRRRHCGSEETFDEAVW